MNGGYEQTFTASIVMNCPVRFHDDPNKKWRVFHAFMIEKSDGTDDPEKRVLVNFGFFARLCSKSKKDATSTRFIEIRRERTLRVEDVTDQSVTFVIVNDAGAERKVTFIKKNSEDINFIYAS